MGNIIGEELPEYTAKQINKRQEIHGNSTSRTPQELTVLNSNTSWVKLASGVSVDKNKLKELELNENLSGMALARENILSGGTSRKPKGTSKKGGTLSPKKYSQSPVAGYEHTEDFGIVPMPGIESISIKNLNRGSIKKANIKIKVYSRSQFEIIDTLYLRLGYTALLEWGNTSYISNDTKDQNGEFKRGEFTTVKNTLVEDPTRFFNIAFEKDRSWRDILPVIDRYRARYNGNYDGFLGKISNFSWDFNPDGSYDISLEMISMGDVIESLKSNVSIDTKLGKSIDDIISLLPNEEGEDEPNPLAPYNNNNIITSMLWLWKYINKDVDSHAGNKALSITTGNDIRGFIGRILSSKTQKVVQTVRYVIKDTREDYIHESRIAGFPDTPVIRKGVTIFDKETIFTSKAESDEFLDFKLRVENNSFPSKPFKGNYYITEKIQVDDVLATSYLPTSSVIRLNTPNQDHYIRLKYLMQYIKEKIIPNIKANVDSITSKYPPLFEIDDSVENTLMYSLPNQISFDPRVCVVRNDSFFKSRTPNTPAKVLPQLPAFRSIDENSSSSPNVASIMNIYLNFDFVVSSLDSNTDDRGDVGLFGFIDALCTGINKAMGGINNLEPIIDESTNTLKIIDSTPIPGRTKDKGKYGLEVVGYNPKYNSSTFLRNINLKTAITPEYATMMTVGATAGGYVKGVEATAFSNWNKGLTDRFKSELTSAQNEGELNEIGSDGNEAERNYVNNYLNQFVKCYGFIPTNGWGNKRVYIKFVDDTISSNISIVTEYFKFLQNKNKNGGSIGFIPFKFSFDMDGLSGFKIYNKLHVSTRFLPRNYGNTLDFVITGVTNDVKSNDWTTSIETMVIPKSTEIANLEINDEFLQQSIESGTYDEGSGTNEGRRKVKKSSTLLAPGSGRPIIVRDENHKKAFKNSYGSLLTSTDTFFIRKGNGNPNSYVEKFNTYLSSLPTDFKNITIKTIGGNQLGNGADITEDLYNVLVKLNDILQKPEYKTKIGRPIMLTAGNDAYHHGKALGTNYTGKPWRTTHVRGIAIDVRTTNSVSKDNIIIDALEEAGFTGILYHDPPHIHVNFQ